MRSLAIRNATRGTGPSPRPRVSSTSLHQRGSLLVTHAAKQSKSGKPKPSAGVAAAAAHTAPHSKGSPGPIARPNAKDACLEALLGHGYSKEDAESIIQALTAGNAAPAGAVNGKQAASPKPKFKAKGQPFSIATQLVHGQTSVHDPYHSSGAPLWQTATYAQPSATELAPYDYTRSANPTRTMLEEQMAALEGADRSFSFTSGMAAISVVCKLVKAGEHIVAGEDIYGGTSRLLAQVVPMSGVSVTNVDMTDLEAVKRAIIPGKTKLVHIESPTNPRMQICDIRAICRMARAAGALTCVDNSIMAPVFQRPLDLGADVSMTSGTKFIGGHGDVTLGILSVRGQELAKRVYLLQNAEGAGLAPFDCWLALRGLKTMSLRMERSAHNAARLAEYLQAHPLVRKVNYAGLACHPGHELHMSQALDGGSLLSFETGSLEASKIIAEHTKLFKVTVSFGNVNSLISLPCFMSHAAIPPEVRRARGLPDDLVRVSAGIEDAADLIADLDQAMELAMKTIGFDPARPTPGVGKAAATHVSHGAEGNSAVPFPEKVAAARGGGRSGSGGRKAAVEPVVVAGGR